MKRSLFPLAFALVFLPPRKEVEDWQSSPKGKTIDTEQLQDTALDPGKVAKITFKNEAHDWRFSFDGSDSLSLVLKRSQRPEWDTKLPPVEKEIEWPSGAWSGLSLTSNEISHFYMRQTKRGPEPRFRAYTLAPDLEQVDFELCEGRKAWLLQKELKGKASDKAAYRLTLVTMVSSQELKRDAAYTIEIPSTQDFTGLRAESCLAPILDGWPKSFRISLK